MQIAAHGPVLPKRSRQAQRQLGSPRPDAPLEGGAEVVELPLHPVEPRTQLRSLQLADRRRRQRREVVGVPLADEVELAERLQALDRKFAQRLEQVNAR